LEGEIYMLTHSELGARLKNARESSGYTQNASAIELGISRQKLISVEKGSGPIDTILLTAMASLYGYSVDYLLSESSDQVDIKLAFRSGELEDDDQNTINWARKILINIRDLNEIIREG